MKNIVNILIISFFLYSCIEIIKTSDTDVYESIHIQGSGWFEFYENNENESLILPNDFTFQVWFSGENQHNNEAQCIISLIGNNSSIAIYKNPSIENRIMIYNNDNLIQELDLESMNFNNEQNFYLLSITNTENQITIYINDMVITNDDSSPLIINSDDNLKPTIGAILNNNYPNVNTVLSNQQNLNDILPLMDVIINGIYIPGASAPKIIDQALLQQLKNNCLIVDVAIDQGGSVENLTPTSHDDPIVNINQVYGYAVPNMPGVVPRTASKALNEATFPYIEYLANNGVEHSIKNNNEIANGVNTYKNKLTSKPVADSLNLNFSPLDELI